MEGEMTCELGRERMEARQRERQEELEKSLIHVHNVSALQCIE